MILGTPVAHNALLPMKFVQSLLRVREFTHIMQEGPSIPDNRNAIFERARFEGDCLLMIDSDMVFTPEDIKRIEELLRDRDIVTGVCVMSFIGYPPSLFKKNVRGHFLPTEPPKEIEKVDGCGAAFLGISKRVITDLIEPFTPLQDKETGRFYGEDISFCIRANEANYKIWCDPLLNIGHIKSEVKYYGK